VPHCLKKLHQQLPKPCYPDARPNTPTAWTVADQYKEQKKQNKAAAKLSDHVAEEEDDTLSGLDCASIDQESQSVQSSATNPHKSDRSERSGRSDQRSGKSDRSRSRKSSSKDRHQPRPPPAREPSKENLQPQAAPRPNRSRVPPTAQEKVSLAQPSAPPVTAADHARARAAAPSHRNRPSRLW
jgi:hypothetical protein